jgi:superfamily II DNA or RNA helicase
MNFFAPGPITGWSVNDRGLAVFFLRRADLDKAAKGTGAALNQQIWRRFTQLLECGEANVESARGGVFIAAEDAVRLDRETRELLNLPPAWPGYFRLATTSVPTLRDFATALQLVDEHGHTAPEWKLKGPVLEVGADSYLPDSAQFTCLMAFLNWKAIPASAEADHLRFLHALTEAAANGARIDVSQAGDFKPVQVTETAVDAAEQADGTLLLTPVPLATAIPTIFSGLVSDHDPTGSTYEAYRNAIADRLHQLGSEEGPAILRVGSTILLLDEPEAHKARMLAKHRKVPREQVQSFRDNPARWLSDHVFHHGEVEFLPRVIGVGEWTGGYLGDSGELGDRIDWFDKQPEPERNQDITRNPSGDEGQPQGTAEDESESVEGPLVPIIEKNDEELAWGLREHLADDPDTIRFIPQLDRYPRKPFPHQEDAVQWLARHAARCGKPARWLQDQKYWGAGALLADDMGLGKTFSTLLFLSEWHHAWSEKTGSAPPACLIVCPLSLVDNWHEEIIKAYGDKMKPFSRVLKAIPDGTLRSFFATPDGRDKVRPAQDSPEEAVEHYGLRFGDNTEQSLDQPGTIVVTTYTTLRDYRFSFAGCNWSGVVFDEAQNIKNPNALQTIAAKSLKGFFRLALSGTPVENHLGDLWCLMDTVEPGALGSYREFRNTWIQPIQRDPSCLPQVGEALRRKVEPLILRRTKEDSLLGLPPKEILKVHVKMTKEQGRLYDEILQGANAPVADEGEMQRVNRWLASMWELRRVSLHPALLGDARPPDCAGSKQSREFLKQSAKLAWLLEKLDQIQPRGEKVLIFAIQKRFQDLLVNHLEQVYQIRIPLINGDTKALSSKTNETRLGLIQQFSDAPGFGICVLSPIAAGAGLNIIAANHVIHMERHWNAAKEDQATDRAYRIGQQRHVFVHLPLLEHPSRPITTFDTGLDRLIDLKKNLAGSLGLLPVGSIKNEELFASVIKGASGDVQDAPVYLTAETARSLSWDLFEALIALIFDRQADQVILTPRGRDHGADVIVLGHQDGTNRLIQVKTTSSRKLDSEEAVRQLEGSIRYFEASLGKTFPSKDLFTNVRDFSKRTRKAAKIYGVSLHGEDWLRHSLTQHPIRVSEVVARNARRQGL